MPAQIAKEDVAPDVVVVRFSGSISEDHDRHEVESLVNELLRNNHRKVVFDLTRLEYMDSLGVGAIVMCSAKLRKAGGELRLAGAWGMVDELLRLTRVKEIVSFYASTKTATEEFTLPE